MVTSRCYKVIEYSEISKEYGVILSYCNLEDRKMESFIVHNNKHQSYAQDYHLMILLVMLLMHYQCHVAFMSFRNLFDWRVRSQISKSNLNLGCLQKLRRSYMSGVSYVVGVIMNIFGHRNMTTDLNCRQPDCFEITSSSAQEVTVAALMLMQRTQGLSSRRWHRIQIDTRMDMAMADFR
nr:hypothetical protein Iba_chr01aCG21150 [Ipomoea batatas]